MSREAERIVPSWRSIAAALAVAFAITASATLAHAEDESTLPSAATFRIAPHPDRLSLLALPSVSGGDIDIDFGFARAPRLSLRHLVERDTDRTIPVTGTRTASALLVMSCSW